MRHAAWTGPLAAMVALALGACANDSGPGVNAIAAVVDRDVGVVDTATDAKVPETGVPDTEAPDEGGSAPDDGPTVPDPGQCIPDCAEKACGDDGCGGTCGQCEGCFGPDPGLCLEGGSCSTPCCPSCEGSTGPKACGDDGCGGACGTCAPKEICTNGSCACVPQCEDGSGGVAACGDDGCGGTCGTCGPDQVCASGACVTECTADCGSQTCGDDGCGGTCGTCEPGEACDDGACACAPSCAGKQCGDDGCGGACGTCGPDTACAAGVCQCVPQCGSAQAPVLCGPNGCGGSCGDCPPGQQCSAQGTCAVAPAQTWSTSIGGWTMTPGKETTKCVVKKLNNPTPLAVTQIHSKLAPGSHHLIVYRVNDQPEQPEPFGCTPFTDILFSGAVPILISEVPEETLHLPEGVGILFEPNQTLRIEAHYLNYFTEDITAHADVDITGVPEGAVEHLADMLFYGQVDFEIPAGATVSTPWKHLDVPNDVKVFGMTGHTHQWGTNVEVTKSTSAQDPGTWLYPGDDPFDWAEAPFVKFDPPLHFAQGDGLRMRCTWTNQSNSKVGFGESADKEMCFTWAYYYPSQGTVLCADGLFSFGCPNDG